MKKTLIFLAVIIIIASFLFFYLVLIKNKTEKELILENNLSAESIDYKKNEAPIQKEKIEQPEVLPEKILIQVPFTTQAPFANWDEYHEEACEEASLVMFKYFLDNKELNPEIAEQEIQNLIKFQLKTYGDYKDSNAQQIVKLAKDYYKIQNLKVIYDFQKADLKKYLAKGQPIIVPAAGRLLGNPNFKSPGPLYHNLVLIGYNGDTIITNDPGTKKGRGYTYSSSTLYNAIHDFTGQKEEIEKGRKAMIVFE